MKSKIVTIPEDAIDQRDYWMEKYRQGHISLADAIFWTMKSGAPATTDLLDAYLHALTQYQDGAFTDLADAMGCEVTSSERSEEQKDMIENSVINAVKGFHEEPKYFAHSEAAKQHLERMKEESLLRTKGYPLTRPGDANPETAFEMASKMTTKNEQNEDVSVFGKSASTIYDIYHHKTKRQKDRKKGG